MRDLKLNSNCDYSIASSSSYYDEARLKDKFQSFLLKLESAIAHNKINDAFFHSISVGINRLCKYKNLFPIYVDELVVQILYIVIQSGKKLRHTSNEQNANFDQCIINISNPLIYLLTTKTPCPQKKLPFLQNWIVLVSSVNDRNCIEKFMGSNDFLIKHLFNYIFESGQYTVQFLTLCLLIKYFKSNHITTQHEILDRVLQKLPELRKVLLNFDTSLKFEGDYRKFLNIFNLRLSVTPKIYSYCPTTAYLGAVIISNDNNFWINLNSEMNTVSFFLPAKDVYLEHLKTDLIMCEYDINMVKLCKSNFDVIIETNSHCNIIPRSAAEFVELNLSILRFKLSRTDFISLQQSNFTVFTEVKPMSENASNTSDSGSDKENIFLDIIQKRNMKRPLNSNIQQKNSGKKEISPLCDLLQQSRIKSTQQNQNPEQCKEFFVPETSSSSCNNDKIIFNNIIVEGTSSSVSRADQSEKPQKIIPKANSPVMKIPKPRNEIVALNLPKKTVVKPKTKVGKRKMLPKNQSLSSPEDVVKKHFNPRICASRINKKSELNNGDQYQIPTDDCCILEEKKCFKDNPISKISNEGQKIDTSCIASKITMRTYSDDSQILNSERLINLVRPLQALSQQPTSLVDQDQIRCAIEEYSLNNGIVGISNHLKEARAKAQYTVEQLDNAAQNLKKFHSSFESTAKKFFQNDEPKETVYDLENILKDCKKKPLTRLSYKSINNKSTENVNLKLPKRLKKTQKKVRNAKQEKASNYVSKNVDIKSTAFNKELRSGKKQDISVGQNLKATPELTKKSQVKQNLDKFDILKISEPSNVKLFNTKTKKCNAKIEKIDALLSTSKVPNIKELKLSNKYQHQLKTKRLIYDLTGASDESTSSKKSIISKNLPSPNASEILPNTPVSLPSSYVIDLDVSETNPEPSVNICKDWLIKKFLTDVAENRKTKVETAKIQQRTVSPTNSEELSESIATSGSVITVIHPEANHNQKKKTECHYSPYPINNYKTSNEIKSNHTFLVKSDTDSHIHNELNKVNKNISTPKSLGSTSLKSISINLSPISNTLNVDGADVIQMEPFKKKSRSLKRKNIEDNVQFESKILKLNRPYEDNFNDVIGTRKENVTDLSNIYKEKLLAKASEITDKYETKMVLNNLGNIQKTIHNYIQHVDDVKQNLKNNERSIDNLKLKLRGEETKKQELIHIRNKYFGKIRSGFMKIYNYNKQNKANLEVEYKKSIQELRKASVAIGKQLWSEKLDQTISSFVQNLSHHYSFEET